MMRDQVWKEFMDKYPHCPNPNHYPKSAEFFLNAIIHSNHSKELIVKEKSNDSAV